ncbi:MAG: invasion associated locus B family protein [Pseudomonadota bacterium]
MVKGLSLLIAAIFAAGAVAAQTTSTQTDATTGTSADSIPLSMGEAVDETSGRKVGETYVLETTGDWQIRCVQAPEGQKDPCQLFQLLRDSNNTPLAEMNIIALPNTSQAAAGANIIVPLETLLTEQLRMTIDGRNARRYPYSFCTDVGCLARLGLSQEDVNGFRRGNSAQLSIVHAAQADKRVDLNVSLTGFTAGFKRLEELRDADG